MMNDDDWLDPAAMLAWTSLLEVHSRLLPRIEAQLVRDGRVTHAQYGVLLVLQAQPQGLPMKEIARRLYFSKSGLTYQVDRLVDAGHVTRAVAPDDSRSRVVRITAAGFAVIRDVWPGHAAILRDVFHDGLDAQQLQQLASGLAAISARLGPPEPRQ